jgi:hypothetical protein
MTFEQFWQLYPRKVGKLTAKRSWEKLSQENKQKALEAIVEHRKFWVAKGTDWEFIPHASTWLNQERFEDELDMTPKQQKVDKDWMFSNEGIEQKARELGILGNGYDTYQSLKLKCMKALGMSMQ